MNALRNDPATCAALGRALADGRFAEDPQHWRVHVEACAACRASVEGFVELRACIARARREAPRSGAAHDPHTAHDPHAVVAHAMARFRLLRARQRTLLGTGAALALGLGVAALWTGRPAADRGPGQEHTAVTTPEQDSPEGALGFAMDLHWTVFPHDGSPPRLDLLRTDAAQRARFEAALDHRSAVVRRVALSALTSSGIPMDRTRLEEVLGTWNEDLEPSLSLAAAPGADRGRLVAAALARGREETLQAALSAAESQAVQGGKPVATALVLPHLKSGAAGVQLGALDALMADPGYVPGEELEKLLGNGQEPLEVRRAAAECLERRLGDEGVRRVVAGLGRMPTDGRLELELVPVLTRRPEGLRWARHQVDEAETPVQVALACASVFLQRGEGVPREALVRRALAEKDPVTAGLLLECCWRGDWTAQRTDVQAQLLANLGAWRRARLGGQVATMLPPLLSWDESSGTVPRLSQALDICAEIGQDRTRWITQWLTRIAAHPDADLAARAKVLLAQGGPR